MVLRVIKSQTFRCCRSDGLDIGGEADPSSDPAIVNSKARKALDKLRPLLKSEDPSLNFREVSNCRAEEPHNSMLACVP